MEYPMYLLGPHQRCEYALENICKSIEDWRFHRKHIMFGNDALACRDDTYTLDAFIERIYDYALSALGRPLPVLTAEDFPLEFPADESNLVLVDDDEEPEEN